MKTRGAKKHGAQSATELEATISELSPGGDGVAIVPMGGLAAERRAVFVRGVVCGDRVRLAVDTSTRPARGRVIALLEAGPDRVQPPCPWSSVCGGCDWMQVSATGQRTAHAAHVRGALPLPWRDVAIAMHAAPRPLAYRTRARVHARASGGRAIVGMNEARTRDPIEVETCAVLHPDLEASRARFASLLEGAHGRGEAQLALGAFPTLDGAPRRSVIDLHWSGALAPACFGRLERAIADGWLAGARVTAGETRVPAKIGDPTPWIRGGDGLPLRLAPGGFGQASDEGNAMLALRVAEHAREALAGRSDARVLELYAGAGNFTVLLASLAQQQLVAVESARESCDAARANLVARGVADRARVVEADAGAFAIPPRTHLVILDPPRTGARELCGRIAASSAKHVVYVSCDTQTLARDLALLSESFVPHAVDALELFPQTSHVEAVVHLERRRRE
ncbi:MAG: class I SAM-dependent RNA methyltransferase [Polyangiaceae bacterium]